MSASAPDCVHSTARLTGRSDKMRVFVSVLLMFLGRERIDWRNMYFNGTVESDAINGQQGTAEGLTGGAWTEEIAEIRGVKFHFGRDATSGLRAIKGADDD